MKVIKYKTIQTLIKLAATSLILASCSIDHRGLQPLPLISGTMSQIICPYVWTQAERPGTPQMDEMPGAIPLTINVCTNGRPSPDIQERACRNILQTAENNSSAWQSNYRLSGRIVVVPLAGETCRLIEETLVGDGTIGSSIQMLSPSGNFRLLNDNTGGILGKNNFSKINAYVASSNIVVDVKYAVWRQGRTKAKGMIQMDGGNCNDSINECPIVLRYLSLDIDNFKINRGIAGSDRVTDAKIYTLNNYEGILSKTGKFDFKNVKLIITGKVDGKAISMLAQSNVTIHGKFKNYLGSTKLVPQTIELRFSHRDSGTRINMSLSLKTTKFATRLLNVGTGKCIRGILNTRNFREVRASIESCTQKTKPQNWILVKKRNLYQIMQQETHSCLNLKSASQNREGGSVGIVNCSNHIDQLWRIKQNGKIVHKKTGKCLNVHRGRQNRNGGLVSVYSCANTIDQKWKLIHTK